MSQPIHPVVAKGLASGQLTMNTTQQCTCGKLHASLDDRMYCCCNRTYDIPLDRRKETERE